MTIGSWRIQLCIANFIGALLSSLWSKSQLPRIHDPLRVQCRLDRPERPHPLRRQPRQTAALRDAGGQTFGVGRAIGIIGGEAEEAQDAQEILADAQIDPSQVAYIGDDVKDEALDTNVTCYIANGAWHHYHSTGDRRFLDLTRQQAGEFETVFVDPEGQLTEGSRTSLFVEREGRLLTPPLSRGLMPGILRAKLIEDGRAEEAELTPADLQRNDRSGTVKVRRLHTFERVANG